MVPWVGLHPRTLARIINFHVSGQPFVPFFRSNPPNRAARTAAGPSLFVHSWQLCRARASSIDSSDDSVDQVRPGMQGYAFTIFAGDQVEKFDLEVIGVMPNFLGPKQSIILVQLKGQKVEHTGVVAGMSGSPVYLDGKLAGALSLKLGIFTKEPIAGVTPIADVIAGGRFKSPAM